MSAYDSFSDERNALLSIFEEFIELRATVTELVETRGPTHPTAFYALERMEAKSEALIDGVKFAAMRAAGGVL